MENEPFLTPSQDEKRLHYDVHQPGLQKNERAWPWKKALAFHVMLAIAYTAITVALLHKNTFFVKPTESSGESSSFFAVSRSLTGVISGLATSHQKSTSFIHEPQS